MGYILIILWLTLLPVCAGSLFSHPGSFQPSLCLIKGQFLLWALFQLITVPVVLGGKTLDTVMILYLPSCLALALAGVLRMCRGVKSGNSPITAVRGSKSDISAIWRAGREEKILLLLFCALLLFQIFQAVTKTAADADDAFYMTVANIADYNGSLYQINPYSIGSVELNYRYVLAPYPVWIAFLARISGLHALTVGHIVIAVYMLIFSYLIYWQTAGQVSAKIPARLLFLICVCVLNIWGNTSSYTPASFLLIRTRQGKGFASGVVFPAFVWGLLYMGNRLDQGEKCTASSYVLMGCILLAGCLGSAICGAILLLAWAGIHCMWAVAYRRPGVLLKGGVTALPAAVFPALYMILR